MQFLVNEFPEFSRRFLQPGIDSLFARNVTFPSMVEVAVSCFEALYMKFPTATVSVADDDARLI